MNAEVKPVAPWVRIAGWLRTPSLRSGLSFAAGGVGFALGNVLLARVLPEQEYGRIALFLALIQLGMVLGPLGVETLINRHRLQADVATLGRVSSTGLLAATGIGAFAHLAYGLGVTLSAVLALSVLGAALNRTAAAFFQSERRFGPSLALILVHNWVVLLAVPAVVLSAWHDALPAAITICVAYVATAAWGWVSAMRASNGSESLAAPRIQGMWQEGLMALGMQLAVISLYQLDRLIIPAALSLHALATYAVVSSIAASPFRMLQTGLSFSLLPQLRACESRGEIRKLLVHETGVAVRAAALAAIAVLLFTQPAMRILLGDRYEFSTWLLVAFVLVGFVRIWSGIAGACATALGSARDIAVLNACGWVALGLAAVAAHAARGAGLTGIVYGVGVGWLGLAIAGSVIGGRAIFRRGAL